MAAGEGSRMRPLTATRPKVMLPVAGKPVLEHLISECCRAGISQFVLIVGYHQEHVRAYFGAGETWGINIRYATQRYPHGTADALLQALPLLDGPFLLLNGDIMLKAADIASLLDSRAPTMSLIELPDVSGMGVVEIDGELVTRVHEKVMNPPTNLANAGAYYFTVEIYSALNATPRSSRGEYEITDTIQMMIDSGVPVKYRLLTSWRDVGYPWELLSANEELLKEIESSNEGVVDPGVTMQGTIVVGSGSVIRSGSYITGPVVIGRHCDIGPNCFIRPFTSIGDHCHIGAGVEIKNSIIMSHSKIPHLSYIGDSVIGENCNLGAGTQVGNLRFDRGNIRVQDRDTGRRKLGVMMGDGVSTGVNASINPGTTIGAKTIIGPGALASGDIAANARVF